MNKPFLVEKIETFDIKNILNYINQNNLFYDSAFNNLYNRKENFYKVLSHIIVDNFTIKDQESYINFIIFLSPLLKKIKIRYGNGSILKMQLSKMCGKNSIIHPHSDIGLIFRFSHRIHIPIITNENVDFFVDDKKFNLKTNNVYEINNSKIHSVLNRNQNSFERIHLIVDFIENKYIPFVV